MTRRFARILTRIWLLSFLHAVRVARRKLPLYGAIPHLRTGKPIIATFSLEVLQERVPLRPPLSNARGVKRKMSGYPQVRCQTPQVCCQPIILIVK